LTALFCLDTNIVVGVMTGRAPHLVSRLREELRLGTPPAIPAIVLFELRYGAVKSAFPDRNLARLQDFLTATPQILPFDDADAAEAGAIRAFLEALGKPIGAYDVLIAAQTRRRGAALVTMNRREFERVPGLMVTDWAT
jgi:tRNA(fMet)-specific endonuclease VapC